MAIPKFLSAAWLPGGQGAIDTDGVTVVHPVKYGVRAAATGASKTMTKDEGNTMVPIAAGGIPNHTGGPGE